MLLSELQKRNPILAEKLLKAYTKKESEVKPLLEGLAETENIEQIHELAQNLLETKNQ